MKNLLLASFCLGSIAQALEVHEWGTFTVLSGPNRTNVPWYVSWNDIAKLPPFVLPPTADKGVPARIRMETPVIYLYPEKEMKISVNVSFTSGLITETFPHSPTNITGVDPLSGLFLNEAKWSGTLHPPTDKQAQAAIPAIPPSENAEPYGAAREVPDAWIFESDLTEIPGLKVQPPFPQMEKFIFYRGVGNSSLPISATIGEDTLDLMNDSGDTLRYAVALRVRDNLAGWVAIPPVADRSSKSSPAPASTSIPIPTPNRSLDEVESELADAWKAALTEDGLTPAEASAMVETWRQTWFREPGDRILSLVPRKTIDTMLPLAITPSPAKTNRVFVARIELLAPERMEPLITLLNSTTEPGPADAGSIANLHLGRFETGAIEIATQLQTQRMRTRHQLIRTLQLQEETSPR